MDFIPAALLLVAFFIGGVLFDRFLLRFTVHYEFEPDENADMKEIMLRVGEFEQMGEISEKERPPDENDLNQQIYNLMRYDGRPQKVNNNEKDAE